MSAVQPSLLASRWKDAWRAFEALGTRPHARALAMARAVLLAEDSAGVRAPPLVVLDGDRVKLMYPAGWISVVCEIMIICGACGAVMLDGPHRPPRPPGETCLVRAMRHCGGRAGQCSAPRA